MFSKIVEISFDCFSLLHKYTLRHGHVAKCHCLSDQRSTPEGTLHPVDVIMFSSSQTHQVICKMLITWIRNTHMQGYYKLNLGLELL